MQQIAGPTAELEDYSAADFERIIQTADPALKRYAEPAEIAETVAFLLSENAAHVTGSAVAIDAGITAGIG